MDTCTAALICKSFEHAAVIRGFYDEAAFRQLAAGLPAELAGLPDADLLSPDADLSALSARLQDYLLENGYGGSTFGAAFRVIDMAAFAARLEAGSAGGPESPARMKAEADFRTVYEQYNEYDTAIEGAVQAFFEEDPDGEIPLLEGDLNVLDVAGFLSRLPLAPDPEEEPFLENLGVQWADEQTRMIGLLAGRIGGGKREGFSFRAAWDRIAEPAPLLWTAYVLGADEEDLLEAAQAAGDAASPAEACSAVRAALPFAELLECACDTLGFDEE